MKKINWQYTFGEILIVIIGISIAFSLNKCAENSKNENEKNQYLNSLINDVKVDKTVLEANVAALEKKIRTADEVLPILNSESPDKMSVVGKIFQLVNLIEFTPKDNTYQTLINSGDLKLFDDFEVKTAIEKHYSYYEIMLKSYLRLENIQKEYVGRYFIYNTNFDDFRLGKFGFTDEALLKNILMSLRGSFELKLKASKEGVNSCEELLTVLNKKTSQ